MAKRKLILDKSLADMVVEYCETNLILPDDLLRIAMNQKPSEPFLLDAKHLTGRTQTARMLRILYALWKGDPESFEKAATNLGGHKRLWFGKSWKEVTDTGSSNQADRIGDSGWWVSTNCPWNGMTTRVEKIMRGMGFSWRYTFFVSWFIADRKGRLNQSDYFENP